MTKNKLIDEQFKILNGYDRHPANTGKTKKFFQEGRTKDLAFRLQNLTRLKDTIIQNEAAILKALNIDLSKSTYEGYLPEVDVVLNEIRLAGRKLKSWARPRRVRIPFTLWVGSSRIYYEPYGDVLIFKIYYNSRRSFPT